MYRTYIKRILDFIFALLALLCLGWLLILVAICLHFANKGAGAFFVQERPGKDEKIFKLYKFKTMTDERDADGNLLPDVQRVTKIGAFIRASSIDELPQLLNILKGEMSFIGPRPLLVKYLPFYTREESRRHSVRPGMTGWAQLHGRNSINSWEKRFEYDIEYVDKISLSFDVRIILLTIRNVLLSQGVVMPGLQDDFDIYRMKNRNADE